MGYTLRATLSARMDVREIVDGTTSPGSSDGGNQRVYDQYSLELALSELATSYPAISGQAVDLSKTLSGTTADFDLTAAPWAGDVSKTVDKTGKKLVAILIQASKANNAAGLTFGPQGGNGYALWGAGKTIIVYPGGQLLHFYADPTQAATLALQTPAVAAGAKDLRWTGTAADVVKCLAIFNG